MFSFYLVAQSNLSQPTLSDTSTTIMVQNTLQPWNAFPSQECNFFPGPSTAKVDMIKSEGKIEWGFISHYMYMWYFIIQLVNQQKVFL